MMYHKYLYVTDAIIPDNSSRLYCGSVVLEKQIVDQYQCVCNLTKISNITFQIKFVLPVSKNDK